MFQIKHVWFESQIKNLTRFTFFYTAENSIVHENSIILLYCHKKAPVVECYNILHIADETKMKPPKRCILRNTPSGPAVKILKKVCEGVHILVKLPVAVLQLT